MFVLGATFPFKMDSSQCNNVLLADVLSRPVVARAFGLIDDGLTSLDVDDVRALPVPRVMKCFDSFGKKPLYMCPVLPFPPTVPTTATMLPSRTLATLHNNLESRSHPKLCVCGDRACTFFLPTVDLGLTSD